MKKDKRKLEIKLDKIPRAAAAAVLASGLSGFLLPAMLGREPEALPMYSVMILCALLVAVADMVALPNPVLLGGSAAFLCAGGGLFFLPPGEESIYYALMSGGEVTTARALPAVFMLSGALCLAMCALNRSFGARCAIAGALTAAMAVFIWTGMELPKAQAVLIAAYILLVLCQVCAPRISSDGGAPREMWFVVFSAAVAVAIFSLPYPETRIQWEKLFEIRSSQTLEQLGEALGVEEIPEEIEVNASGYSEDQSNLGGWVELMSDAKLLVEYSGSEHSDRLTGGMYDSYTGTGWLCTADIRGTGYADLPAVSGSDMLPVSGSDVGGSVHISNASDEDGAAVHTTLFFPPDSYGIVAGDSGETALRDGHRMVFAQSSGEDYTAYYYSRPAAYELTAAEREQYLALPDTLPQRVKDLALEAVEGCSDERSMAHELMRVLSRCKYETHVRDLPDGRDFVDYFLFDTSKGYCVYFASSMAVLARCAGIPSRYAHGYCFAAGEDQTATVSSDNAHAWAELYIDGRWEIYDPVLFPVEDIPDEVQDEAVVPEEETSAQDDSALRKVLLFAYAAAAGAAVIFIALKPFFRRIPWRMRARRRYGRSPGYRTIVHCGKLLWVLAACGVKRAESETLTEFGQRISEECPWLDNGTMQNITTLLGQTGRALYSPNAVTEPVGRNTTQAVRKAYIRHFGPAKYLRGHRRASL